MERANAQGLLPRPSSGQRGSVLIIGILLLLMMTLLGLITTTQTRTDARITSNHLDRAMAFQSAEAALREAEARIAACAPTDAACPVGLHDSEAGIPGIAQAARYEIALLDPSEIASAYVVVGEAYFIRGQNMYRVTVFATGRSSSTEVVLQTIFIAAEH